MNASGWVFGVGRVMICVAVGYVVDERLLFGQRRCHDIRLRERVTPSQRSIALVHDRELVGDFPEK
jgi:hypothetical protein